jgi:gamma-glutamylcyclotransferase (GGCT)/AIG2-like uncharacterized protein YtfP
MIVSNIECGQRVPRGIASTLSVMISAMHLFTYGSLMFPEVWKCVVGRRFETVSGTISDFAILLVRDETFPAIKPAKDGRVPGLVYLDVDDASLKRLDRFEGEFYERQELPVECRDTTLTADAYVISLAHRNVLTTENWTAEGLKRAAA